MMKYDIAIIGSGLGSLVCGYILSKEGFNVCILEKHSRLGGCLQTFEREGCIFDTGVHYVGGLDEGQILNRYFRYFGLMDKLKVKKLDTYFDHIAFSDKTYYYATGYDNFVETLAESFPGEKKNLQNYVKRIKEMSGEFPLYNLKEVSPIVMETILYRERAHEFITSVTKNERLQNILAGTNPLYAGIKNKTPLYIHALINNANIESTWRFVDGSSQIAELLAESIRAHGGTVRTGAEVGRLLFGNGSIQYAELKNGERIEAKSFISGIHPSLTLDMIEKTRIRNAYRHRINTLQNSISSFIMYLVFKENTFPYLNHNLYYYDRDDVWLADDYVPSGWPGGYMLFTPASSKSDIYAECMTVMTFMNYNEVKVWEDTAVGRRGEEYLQFKQQKTEQLTDLVARQFPGIRKQIKACYSSSPLTYRDYTGTKYGATYGIQKDSTEIMKTIILPMTKVPNLFLTGQNTNIHGVLGVTIGAVLTCGQFLDINYLVRKISAAS
ncbi:MAG: NAD(P)/FAD-dependent oxidoreductase [Bacteroidetes bacterium]|nr:NAD(P)/FAD-dependent oxidoreductase [Bacteroidota bacterium]